jgi:hypothetical protein
MVTLDLRRSKLPHVYEYGPNFKQFLFFSVNICWTFSNIFFSEYLLNVFKQFFSVNICWTFSNNFFQWIFVERFQTIFFSEYLLNVFKQFFSVNICWTFSNNFFSFQWQHFVQFVGVRRHHAFMTDWRTPRRKGAKIWINFKTKKARKFGSILRPKKARKFGSILRPKRRENLDPF